MEQEPKATGAMETNAAAVWGDEDIPECVHYSTAGDDQVSSNKLYCNGVGLCLCTIVICSCLTSSCRRCCWPSHFTFQRACGPGAVCAGAPGNQGCDQRGLVNPTCLTSGCDQDGSKNPVCIGKCSNQLL